MVILVPWWSSYSTIIPYYHVGHEVNKRDDNSIYPRISVCNMSQWSHFSIKLFLSYKSKRLYERRLQTAARSPQPAARSPQPAARRPQTADRRPQTADRRPQTADLRPQTVDPRPKTADRGP